VFNLLSNKIYSHPPPRCYPAWKSYRRKGGNRWWIKVFRREGCVDQAGGGVGWLPGSRRRLWTAAARCRFRSCSPAATGRHWHLAARSLPVLRHGQQAVTRKATAGCSSPRPPAARQPEPFPIAARQPKAAAPCPRTPPGAPPVVGSGAWNDALLTFRFSDQPGIAHLTFPQALQKLPDVTAVLSDDLLLDPANFTDHRIRYPFGCRIGINCLHLQDSIISPVPVLSGREVLPEKRGKSLVDQGFSPGRVRGSGGWRGWRGCQRGFGRTEDGGGAAFSRTRALPHALWRARLRPHPGRDESL
jgi:hypothetical protein